MREKIIKFIEERKKIILFIYFDLMIWNLKCCEFIRLVGSVYYRGQEENQCVVLVLNGYVIFLGFEVMLFFDVVEVRNLRLGNYFDLFLCFELSQMSF